MIRLSYCIAVSCVLLVVPSAYAQTEDGALDRAGRAASEQGSDGSRPTSTGGSNSEKSSASASDAEEEGEGEGEGTTQNSKEAYEHSGFYARFLNVGIGYLISSDSKLSLVGNLLLGHTIHDGVVLGVLGSLTARGGKDIAYGLFGPFVHYYPQPSCGLYYEASVGPAITPIDLPDGSKIEWGVGAEAAVGYDIWIKDHAGIGKSIGVGFNAGAGFAIAGGETFFVPKITAAFVVF